MTQFADLFLTKCFNKEKVFKATYDSKTIIHNDDKKRRCF